MTHVSKLSIVKSILNVLPNIESDEEFVVELIKACNTMIDPRERNKFTNLVRRNIRVNARKRKLIL